MCCVSVQVSTIEALIKDKKAILTRIENQPLRRCGIPDPFKGSPQVLGKVCVCLVVVCISVCFSSQVQSAGDLDMLCPTIRKVSCLLKLGLVIKSDLPIRFRFSIFF